MIPIPQDARILVTGRDTLVGSAICRRLRRRGFNGVIGAVEPDLTNARLVDEYFQQYVPEFIFHAAGRSGGIVANQRYPAQFMLDNLLGQTHVMNAAHRHGVRKLLFLASSCAYPRLCRQPMQVEDLMTGPLEPTSQAYASAKLAGLSLAQAYRQEYGANFIVGIPANAFGIGDDFDETEAHVIGALIRRMHEARLNGAPTVTVWGTGNARREFIFADDLADACVFVMEHYSDSRPINLGSGDDLSIAELAQQIRQVVSYPGELRFDSTKPDGVPLKALDSSVLSSLGWRRSTLFAEALAATYDSFLQQSGTPRSTPASLSP